MFATDEHAAEAEAVMAAIGYLQAAAERMSVEQRAVFTGVERIEVAPLAGPQGVADAATALVRLDPAAIRKNGIGGRMWLLCHEAWHVSARNDTLREASANRFADRIRALIEREPAIYRWGPSRR